MPRGGARVNSGPPPDPTSARSAKRFGDWTLLPAEGYQGDIPEYPFAASEFGEASPTINQEQEFWATLWRKPQAVMWIKLHKIDQVAMYCRRYCLAAVPDAPAGAVTAVLRLEDDLGLSMAAMAKYHWTIAEDEMAAKRAEHVEQADETGRKPSARERRMKAVRSGTTG
jgi:hypothetical protein